MAENLEQAVKKFAEESRRKLAEQVRQKNNKDTKTVEYQGYSADGKQLVKDGDEIRAIRNTGNVDLRRGEKLIEDSESSVDTPKAQPPSPQPISVTTFIGRRDKEFKAKGPLLQQQELGSESQNEYWVNYRPCPPRLFCAFNYEYEIGAGNGAYMYFGASAPSRSINDYVTTTYTGLNFTAEKRDRTFPNGAGPIFATSSNRWAYSAIAGAHTSISQFSSSPSGYADVQIDGSRGGVLQRNVPTTYLGTTYYAARSILHNGSIKSGSSYGSGGTASSFNLSGGSLPKYQGYAGVVAQAQGTPIEEFPYYYFHTYDRELDADGFFAYNIYDYVPAGSEIVRVDRIHNYYRKIVDVNNNNQEIVMNYAIFIVVLTDDFSDEYEVSDGITNATGHTMKACFGRLSHKVLHFEIDLTNFNTFNVRSNSLNPYSGNTQSMVKNTTGWDYPFTYLFPSGALHYSEVYSAGHTIFSRGNNVFTAAVGDRGIKYLDPTPIFSNAFANDWISPIAFSNTGFDTSPSSFHWDTLLEFLSWGEIARFLGTFNAFNAVEKPSSNCSGTYICEPFKVTKNQVDLRTISTIADIINLVENQTDISGCQGSRIDFHGEDFKEVYGVKEMGSFYSYVVEAIETRKYSVPDVGIFAAPEKSSTGCGERFIVTDFPYYGNYLGGEGMQFYKKNEDYYHTFLPIISYRASNGVVTFSTKYLHAFVPGDSLTIAGTGVFDTNNAVVGADTQIATAQVVISASVPDTGTTNLSGAYVALN